MLLTPCPNDTDTVSDCTTLTFVLATSIAMMSKYWLQVLPQKSHLQ
jgi:hypothetical protein